MNAQEALNELKAKRVYDIKSYQGNTRFTIEQDKEAADVLQQFIDQANAKPKTLEDLGWVQLECGNGWGIYCVQRSFGDIRLFINKNEISFDFDCDMPLTHEEIIAIAEKMKELVGVV